MATHDILHCKNCQADLHGAYCAQCGQKVITHRLTFARFVSDSFRQFTDLDRGLWYTLWMLFKRPGQVVQDYLHGITIPYTPPIRYLILWITVSFLAYFSFGNWEQQMAELDMWLAQEPEQPQLKWQEIVQKYSQLFALLNVPILALMTWLFVRKQGMNYTEHLIGNAYWYGQISFLSLLLLPVQNLLGNHSLFWGTLLALVLMQGYYLIVMRGFFRQSWLAALIKSLLVVLLGFVMYSLVAGFIGAIYGLLVRLS